MTEPVKKRVDESWKEQAEREKQAGPAAPAGAAPRPVQAAPASPAGGPSRPAARPEPAGGEAPEAIEARFDLFLSGLAMEALIALGDMPHPVTKKHSGNLAQAKYLIDLIGILDDKTKGNLTADEAQMLKDLLYQLRMRYLTKSGGAVSPTG